MQGTVSNSNPRPRLLLLVYGASLLLIATSGLALVILASGHISSSVMTTTVGADQGTVRDVVTTALTPDEVRTGVLTPQRAAALSSLLVGIASDHGMLALTVASASGTILASSQPGTVLSDPSVRGLVAAASAGNASATVADQPSTALTPARSVLTEDLPVAVDGSVRLVFVAERDAAPIVAETNAAWSDLLIVTLAGAALLAGILYLIFNAANARLARQQKLLVEATRTDPLTGLLNHGSIVAELTDNVASDADEHESLGIALIDIDNFRSLNEVHGEAAGDEALRQVADALQYQPDDWTRAARYGPDEFLAVAHGEAARRLGASLDHLQRRLGAVHLQFGQSDPLPLTVSAGISYFPFHARSVTDLLSAATVALGEAKGGGGGTVRIADARAGDARAMRSTFDVLQGLVLAIDTKDHYTKRHSDDVACYAMFLASWLGLPVDFRQALGAAALLHDVGKIGIPEELLRKPDRLTAAEYEVMKRHVDLGDMIVRDLPDVGMVRAGIRFHHERWDGTGYPDGLAGESIPRIARLVAVADVFSAMTTTRPYRKALSLGEAIERLTDAAGAQLDPELVVAFLDAIENAPDAPLPGSNRQIVDLWVPKGWAA